MFQCMHGEWLAFTWLLSVNRSESSYKKQNKKTEIKRWAEPDTFHCSEVMSLSVYQATGVHAVFAMLACCKGCMSALSVCSDRYKF